LVQNLCRNSCVTFSDHIRSPHLTLRYIRKHKHRVYSKIRTTHRRTALIRAYGSINGKIVSSMCPLYFYTKRSIFTRKAIRHVHVRCRHSILPHFKVFTYRNTLFYHTRPETRKGTSFNKNPSQ
jgi:hypothetical protein